MKSRRFYKISFAICYWLFFTPIIVLLSLFAIVPGVIALVLALMGFILGKKAIDDLEKTE